MPEPSRPLPVCPLCHHEMQFACKVGHVEIYGCKHCGSTFSAPIAEK